MDLSTLAKESLGPGQNLRLGEPFFGAHNLTSYHLCNRLGISHRHRRISDILHGGPQCVPLRAMAMDDVR